ncbi:MAG TPA: hypothetical protein VKI44_05670 [Acetobacteraceae bacterium]|nr:hypothetical protein [Acetobacteraceae bacterium]
MRPPGAGRRAWGHNPDKGNKTRIISPGDRRHRHRCHRLRRNDPWRRENVEQTGADGAGHARRRPNHREVGVARVTTEANQRVAAVTSVTAGDEAEPAGPAFTAVATQETPTAALTADPAGTISAPADAAGTAGTQEQAGVAADPAKPADPATSAGGVADPAGAAGAARTNTFLGERYRRIVKRRGKLKALVAVARSILVIIWNMLNDPTAGFRDLGADYHTTRINTERRTRNYVTQLMAMGYRVTLEPAA